MNLVCALTGVTGLLGSHCERYLKERGYQILPLVRKPSVSGTIPFQLGQELDPKVFRGVQALIHCAYDHQAKTWDEIYRINVEGSKKLFSSAREGGVNRIVFISTVSAFEGCRSLYGKGKLLVEEFVSKHGGVIIRPGLIYGDAEGRGMFGALCRIVRLPALPLLGGGRQPLVLVHVEDLVRVIEYAIECEVTEKSRTITAAHPQPVPFRNILRLIEDKQGKKSLLVPVPGWLGLLLLRGIESLGFSIGFSSDSLLGLLYPNPAFYQPLVLDWEYNYRDFRDYAKGT